MCSEPGLRGKRLRLSDDDRRRLAVKAVRSKYSCGFPIFDKCFRSQVLAAGA